MPTYLIVLAVVVALVLVVLLQHCYMRASNAASKRDSAALAKWMLRIVALNVLFASLAVAAIVAAALM